MTITDFIEKQVGLKVKKRDIALSLFYWGYSETQVAKILGVHVKTAHAAKIDYSKAGKEYRKEYGKPKRLELKNYLRGGMMLINQFRSRVKLEVGVPSHSQEAEKQRKKKKRVKSEATP